MEEVVERPAVATRSAKAIPTSKSQSTEKAVAAGHKVPTWRDAALAARNSVSTLLFEASVRDEEERDDRCGMANRLMRVANSEIGELSADATKGEFDSAAFNVEAIIHGALALSDDRVGPEVRGMLTHVLVIIDRLTDVVGGGFGIEALFEAIEAKPGPVPEVDNKASTRSIVVRANAPIDGIRDACAHLNEAVAVLEAYAPEADSDAYYGVCRLMNLAAEEIEEVLTTKSSDDACTASATIAQVLAILTMHRDAEGDVVVGGVITMTQLAKNELDDACERLA